jgi:hypothetical protein
MTMRADEWDKRTILTVNQAHSGDRQGSGTGPVCV